MQTLFFSSPFNYPYRDTRLGIQAQTVSCDMKKTFKMHDRLFIGLSGLGSDIQSLAQLFTFKLNMYKMSEERDISPKTFTGKICESR
jgi:20S proteasome subunit beta 3